MKLPVFIACKRTVVRVPHTRKDEECLNFFGTLAPEVRAVIVVFHIEMWKLGGMSNAVLHNEVEPGQLEISPIFALSCVSAGQKALCWDVLTQCASKYDLTLLLHQWILKC